MTFQKYVFDVTNPKQWALLVVGVLALSFSLVNLQSMVERNSVGDVLSIEGGVPEKDTIGLGEFYVIPIFVHKLRDDCAGLEVARHLYEINTGTWYETERFPVFELEKGDHPFTLRMKTVPLNEKDKDLQTAGVWKGYNRVSYKCPDGPNGEEITKAYRFVTPPFTILEK